MSSDHAKIDEAKGRAKEAAGAITDDDDLRREGKADQAAAKTKEKLNEAVDKGRELASDLHDKVKEKVGGSDDSRSSAG